MFVLFSGLGKEICMNGLATVMRPFAGKYT